MSSRADDTPETGVLSQLSASLQVLLVMAGLRGAVGLLLVTELRSSAAGLVFAVL